MAELQSRVAPVAHREAPVRLTLTDVESMRSVVARELEQDLSSTSALETATAAQRARARAIWTQLMSLASEPAARLAESLKLALQPTLHGKLQGDFKSGKRINMRKVIGFVASNFKKDRIWLRRSQPNQRTYQVMLCVDNSLSMRSSGAGRMALETLAMLTSALRRVDLCDFGVVSFGEGVNVVHPLGARLDPDAAASFVTALPFSERLTRTSKMLASVNRLLDEARAGRTVS
jgi:midasin